MNSEITSKMAFDGPFSVAQLIVIGVIIAVATAIFTWRDCKAMASMRLFVFLCLTRSVALLVALWMLAGATMVTLAHNSKPKSIVLMIDASSSMDTVDPIDGSGNTVAWSGGSAPAVEQLDHVVGTLQAAQSGVSQVRLLMRTDDSGEQMQSVWERVLDAIQSAADQLDRVNLNTAKPETEIAVEAKRVADLLKSGLGPMREQRMTVPRSITRSDRQAVVDRLDEADAFIGAGMRRMENVSRKFAVDLEANPTADQQSKLAVESKLTRKDKVAAWLDAGETSWLKDVEQKERVLRYAFASQVSPVAARDWQQAMRVEQGANVTDLTAALDRASQDAANQSVDAIVLVTDGGHNAGGDPREAAAALRGVPLYVVPIGDSKMPRDVILHHTHAPRAVFKNDNVVVEAMLTAYGCEGEKLQAELLSDGVVVDRKTTVASTMVYDTRFNFQQKATQFGRHKLQVRVAPLHDEYSTNNNSVQMEVDVMEDTIRVLIADDRPRWEFRYLVNLFKRDKHVEFEQLLFSPNDEAQGAAAPSLPENLEGWRKYRVIILGDIAPEQLTRPQQDLLKKYVTEEGGNVIVIAGETAMPAAFADQPLGAMIPTIPGTANNQGVALAVTTEGSASIATQLDDDPAVSARIWRDMSTKLPIYLPTAAKPKPTSHVLIGAVGPGNSELQAFLSWQYVGLGRVAYIAAPVTYQLRYRNGDRNLHRFWGQFLRWVIARDMGNGSKSVRIATDKNTYERGEQAQITVRLIQPDGKPVPGGRFKIEARQGGQVTKLIDLKEESETPGSYHGNFDDLPQGQMALRAVGPIVDSLLNAEGYREPAEQIINVDPKGSSEQSSPLCNLSLLKQLADASGGAVLGPSAVANALAERNAIPEIQQAVLSRQPIWNRWGCLWIFIGCISLEWLARRYWRML